MHFKNKLTKKGFNTIWFLFISTTLLVLAFAWQRFLLPQLNHTENKTYIRRALNQTQLELKDLNEFLRNDYGTELSGDYIKIQTPQAGYTNINCYDGNDNKIKCSNESNYIVLKNLVTNLWYEVIQIGTWIEFKIPDLQSPEITDIQEPTFDRSYETDYLTYEAYQKLTAIDIKKIFHTDSIYTKEFSDYVQDNPENDISLLENFPSPQYQTWNIELKSLEMRYITNDFVCNDDMNKIVSTWNVIGILWWGDTFIRDCDIEITNDNIIFDNIALQNSTLLIKNNSNVIFNNVKILENANINIDNVSNFTTRNTYIDDQGIFNINNSSHILK